MQGGINTVIANNIQKELWKKFIAICVSGLLADARATHGEIREIPETQQLTKGLLTEIYNLSLAMGIKLQPDIAEKTMAFIATYPYTASSSLAKNILDGKPSEIDYQNGMVVKLGEQYGVETPINKFIYSCILLMKKRPGKAKTDLRARHLPQAKIENMDKSTNRLTHRLQKQ